MKSNQNLKSNQLVPSQNIMDELRNGYGYGDITSTDKEIIKDLIGRIGEALDLIKDDPKLEKDMDEIPRLNYIIENIRTSLDGPFRDFSEPGYKKSIGWAH